MDSDHEMADAPSPGAVMPADGHALIKIVRSLDQDGPGEDGQNLQRIWNALSHSPAGQFYAAEQSTLRWLLKTMNSTAKTPADSETIRRYPLTWNILNCVFQRIPLFSLAKALADRRFIAVLRQAVMDIANPADADKLVSSAPDRKRKRKRSTSIAYDVDALRKPDACIKSADALFEALKTLLSRLSTGSDLSTRDAVGAEHIESLFASPAAEALGIVGPLFDVCSNSLAVVDADADSDCDGRVSWVKVASGIWDLRLRGKSDALDVATRISNTTLPMFGKLDADACAIHGAADSFAKLPPQTRRMWAADLRAFLQRNLLLPARAAFMGAGDLEVLNTAVLMTGRQAAVTSPALYLLAQNSPKPLDEKSRQKVSEWLNEVLKAIEGTLSSVDPEARSRTVEGILGEARKNGAKIDESLLLRLSSQYGFSSGKICWSVVSAVLQLDPDMILDGDRGQALLADIIKNIRNFDVGNDEDRPHVMRIIDAIMAAFTNAKDFSSYLKLWYEELGRVDDVSGTSPWLQASIRYDSSVFSKQKLELEITVKQLLDVLEWLGSQRPVRPGTLYVILASVVNGLRSPEFTDVMGPEISNLVVESFKTADAQTNLVPLRWSILSQVMPWLSPDDRDGLWTKVKDTVVEVLELGKLSDEDTLQALKFVFVTWSLMMPDGDRRAEVSSTALAATGRLAVEIPAKLGKRAAVGWNGFRQHGKPSDDHLAWYMDFVLCESSRALPLIPSDAEGEPPLLLDKLFTFLVSADKRYKSRADEPSKHLSFVGEAFTALFSNENVLNNRHLMAYVMESMSGMVRNRFKKSTNEFMDEKIGEAFLKLPNDCLKRAQREHLASLLLGQIQAVEDTVDVSPLQWKLVLAVLTKLMRRSMFSEELDFNFLVTIAEKASRCFTLDSVPRGLDEVRGLAEMYNELAAAVMLQMANHLDTRGQKFFKEAESYLEECPVDEKSTHRARLRLVLLKALCVTLSGSAPLKAQVSLSSEAVQSKLADAVSGVLRKCCRYWKKKPQELSNGSYLYTLLTTLDSSDAIAPGGFEGKSIAADQLVQASALGIKLRRLYGWKLRAFLLKHYPESVDKTVDFTRHEEAGEDDEPLDAVRDQDLVPLVLECTEATLHTLTGAGEKLLYLKGLLEQLEFGSEVETQLTAIRCVVAKLSALPPPTEPQEFDLAAAYTIIVRKALRADNGARFGKVCEILRVILDGTPGHICQWNIEETLDLVATVCSQDASVAKLKDSRETYKNLCGLVELILKRYRLRLVGHFHLVIATMQALLRALLLNPYDAQTGRWAASAPLAGGGPEAAAYDAWDGHAAAYNRLVTLVCEPTAGSVTRSHHGGALDAATDVAKRAAGRMMYLVLMAYVRLQMEVGVPRGVREALEPGVNAVFDVTHEEVRKVMNDGLDRAGRDMMGDLYRRYRTFGKWSGK